MSIVYDGISGFRIAITVRIPARCRQSLGVVNLPSKPWQRWRWQIGFNFCDAPVLSTVPSYVTTATVTTPRAAVLTLVCIDLP
jgi:hypothetical protein